jgi:hypothetical protein
MIDALIKRVFVSYKCYEMRSEQGSGEKVSYFHTSTDALNINLKDNNYDINLASSELKILSSLESNLVLSASRSVSLVSVNLAKATASMISGLMNTIMNIRLVRQ